VLIRTSQLTLTNRLFLTPLFGRFFRPGMLRATRPAPTPPTTPIGFAAGIGHLQFLPQDHNLLQTAENLLRHTLRQIHEAVILMDINMPDVPALQARLVGNGAHDVARLHAVDMAYLDSEGLEGDVVGSALLTRRLAPLKPVITLVTSRLRSNRLVLTCLKARSTVLT
jgi:hypothetical protein